MDGPLLRCRGRSSVMEETQILIIVIIHDFNWKPGGQQAVTSGLLSALLKTDRLCSLEI